MWRNIILCDICQFHYNGNVLAEALKVVEYHWYHWYKSRGVRSLDIDTRVWVRQRTVTEFYNYVCSCARRDQIAEEKGAGHAACTRETENLGRKTEKKRPRGRWRRRWEFNIKGILTQCDVWAGFISLWVLTGYWERCQEPSCSMKGRNCLHQLSKHRYNIFLQDCNFFASLISSGTFIRTVVKVLRYKSEGRWFDPRWCHWNFSLT
jgi:hypothetical protein